MHLIDRPWIVVMSVWSMFPLPFGWLSHGWLTLHWNILQTIKCECPDTPVKAVDCYSFNILSLSLFNVVYPHEVCIFDRFFELSEDVLKHEAWNETCVFHKKQLTAANLFLAAVTRWVSNESDTFANSSDLQRSKSWCHKGVLWSLFLYCSKIASTMRKTFGT